MKSPPSVLVLDSAILVSAALGRSSAAILAVSLVARLVTTDRVVDEVRRRIALGLKRPELLEVMDGLVAEMTVVPVAALEYLISDSEIFLRDAVASRNGSTKDAHVLALAWGIDGDIWSTDRDFAGTGVATWSTTNLVRALPELAARPHA